MTRPKDRLHRVIVIGATPAGIAATSKLGELGIPVILVDTDPDLDQKLAHEEWRLPSGVPLNFAYRSGLIRILRNPRIRCVLPANRNGFPPSGRDTGQTAAHRPHKTHWLGSIYVWEVLILARNPWGVCLSCLLYTSPSPRD